MPSIFAPAGAAAGEIVSEPLEGELVWRDKAEKSVGLHLSPVGGTGTFMAFTCGTVHTTVVGSIVGGVTADKMKSTNTLAFNVKKGEQVPSKFETADGTKVPAFLEVLIEESASTTLETPAVLAVSAVTTNEEALEINGVL